MKYVLFYETAPDAAATIQAHATAHRARWAEFREQGTLIAIGPFADGTGALAVFSSQAAAEQFASGDPFVLHGAVGSWSIREWHEVLL
jgi:uncharacterized protein